MHDRIAAYQRQWSVLLRETALSAQAARDLPADTDADQLAFELGAVLAGASIVTVLHSDDAAIERAHRTIRWMLSPAR